MNTCCEFWKTNSFFDYCPDCGARLSLDAKEILEELDLKWTPRIAVDFDNCLCKSAYPECGEPNIELINLVKQFKELGSIIYLNTCREREALKAAIDWCKSYDLEFDFVNENDPTMIDKFGDCRKLGADLYIDDKAMKICV